jgi:hypothetical protein
MPYTADTEIDLTAKKTDNYIISSQHRRIGNPNKCIWNITFDEEVDCFIQAMNSNWKRGTEGWGVKVINNILQVVGVNNDRQELKLAKFVDGTKTNIWHGYPADYMNNHQDRPETDILKDWVKKGYLTKPKMNKIRRQVSCNL